MSIPSTRECYAILSREGMPPHIVAHSIQVCRVARLLAEALVCAGACLDVDLVNASALLHDITKPRSFDTGENHSETGGAFLAGRGYFRVGDIVRQHVRLDAYHPDAGPTEAGIVNYADKRVLHDRVVSLDRRMAYIRDRYGDALDRSGQFQQLWQASAGLEQQIYRNLDFASEDLRRQVGAVDRSGEMRAFKALAAADPAGEQTAV